MCSSIARFQESAQESRWAKLELVLGVKFKERSLLRQAVVHRSFLNEHPELGLESYERLEYLGDAFLGWVVAQELYRRYPSYTEGDLSRARSSLVEGRRLAGVARGLGLGAYLSLGQGEGASGGRNRLSNLAGALEAVLGAVLLDQGTRPARAMVLRWLAVPMKQLTAVGAPPDAKSALQEWAQRRGLPLPDYAVKQESGPAHARRFAVQVQLEGKVAGEGEGRRKLDAEQAAAAQALAVLESRAG